jgi:ribosomal protein S18 acetylase RimI-like enzyme
MTTDIHVRRAKPEELEAVLNLWVEMMRVHADLDPRFSTAPGASDAFRPTLQAWIADDGRRVLVAVADGQVVGYAIGSIAENPPNFATRRYGHVSDICVDPEWRRQGLAHRLWAGLRTWFRQQGMNVVQLHSAALNPASQAFWRHAGFQDYMDRLWLDI